jgi:hypothetical protein
MPAANAAVLATLRRDVLTPDAVATVLAKTLARYRDTPDTAAAERAGLTRELARVTAELTRLTDALAVGEALEALRAGLVTRTRRQAELQAQLARLDGLERAAVVAPATLTATIAARLTDWQGGLKRHPAQARQILRKLLVGRLAFTPRQDETGAWYEFSGHASYGLLLAGVAGLKEWCPRRGLAVCGSRSGS